MLGTGLHVVSRADVFSMSVFFSQFIKRNKGTSCIWSRNLIVYDGLFFFIKI